MAEHLTRNEKVVGSIPTISSKKRRLQKQTSLFGYRRFILMLGVGKAAPAQFILRGTRAAGQKASFAKKYPSLVTEKGTFDYFICKYALAT